MSSESNKTFARGARPSPRHKLLAAVPFIPLVAPPSQVAYIPKQLSVWGNDRFGDCVSAEEAFAKATYLPEIFIDEDTVVAWARRHGVLNGAGLTDVMDAMQRDGFQVAGQQYNDGPYTGVDYGNESTLQSAISQGPVKIAIDANALPRGAGNQQGWYAFGRGHYPNTDHCVALAGYGPCAWLYYQMGLPLPAGVSPDQFGYLLFTWSTIGVVDYDWLMGTCTEAWIRHPTTIGNPPLPQPPVPPPPVPPIPPVPPPVPPVPPVPVPTFPSYSVAGKLAGIIPFSGVATPVNVAAATLSAVVPPWLVPALQVACMLINSGAGNKLPPWLLALAQKLCAFVPPMAADCKKGCG